MSMRDDFCIFILTHGRPDRVYTYNTLKNAGYTGKVYLIIDDEDKTADEYKKRFGNIVIQFCKEDIDKIIDPGDNFCGRATTIYPRKAFWKIAETLGYRYFVQLDDDYTGFQYYFDARGYHRYTRSSKTLSKMFDVMFDYFKSTPVKTLAMSQGGDFIGGAANGANKCRIRRKAMNVFLCDTQRPWDMYGRRNEDVNAYILGNLRGDLYLTVMQAKITQIQSQINPGAITDAYFESGTYVKSFYSVMYAPSCAKIGIMGDPRSCNYRIHHKINWHNTAPKILREEHKKA